jgi:hypothetical protein
MTDDSPIDWSNVEPEERRFSLSTLRYSGFKNPQKPNPTQPRKEMHEEWVGTLAERMTATDQGLIVDRDGEVFPPISVFYDGHNYWVADGHHRCNAAEEIGADEIQAQLYEGSRREAILYAVGANAKQGMTRNPGDVERVVRKLLLDDEWRYWSDREIARQCSVHHSTVSEYRKEIMDRDPKYREDVGETRTYEQDGEVRQMDISNHKSTDDDDGDEGISATWSPSQSVHKRGGSAATAQVDEPVSDDEDGASDADTGDVTDDERDDGDASEPEYLQRANFEPAPAIQSAGHCMYDPIGSTTIAADAPIRQALEEIGPIDLIVTHGPESDKAFASMVEAAAHTMSEHGVLVVTMTSKDHGSRVRRLQQRFSHQRTQLLDDEPWRLATVWHHDLGISDRYNLSDGHWSAWSGGLYRPWMSAIAVPYATGPALAAGLMGDDRDLSVLTDTEEMTDEIVQSL